MKRRMAFLFILLANICLLVHAVIPHHHHNRIAVSISNKAHQPIHESHQHDHSSEDCQIDDALLVSIKDQETCHNNNEANTFLTYPYYATFEALTFVQTLTSSLEFYSFRVSIPRGVKICTNALRAPPSC